MAFSHHGKLVQIRLFKFVDQVQKKFSDELIVVVVAVGGGVAGGGALARNGAIVG